MTVKELAEKMNLKIFCGETNLDRTIEGCYVSDLLSDVMGNAKSGMAWITLQTHQNVAAIASLKDLSCIILVKGFEPEEDTLQHAIEEEIPILGTTQQTFETAGQVYQLIC